MNKENINKFINEWIDTQDIVFSLTEEIKKVTKIVGHEIERLKNKSENEFIQEVQLWFRIAIRSTIATIEAICYKLKKTTILICDQRKKFLSSTELEKLTEKKQDEDGNLRNYYLETKENIKFSLKMIYYSFDVDFKIKDHESWKKLRDTVDIRHKLTHPKKKKDLDTTAQQYNDASVGFSWFVKKINELNKSSLVKSKANRGQD